MELPKKTVVITGTSTGIGRASVLRLAGAGFVVFAGVRKASDGERLRGEAGDDVIPILIDVTDDGSVRAAVATVGAHVTERGLDALVNNAGVGVTAPVEYLRSDVLRRIFDVNVFGQIAVTQAFLPLIRAARGRIINMGSVGSHLAIPFGGALCGTKSAFRSFNDALRMELHPFGIHVSMIEPGAILTPAADKTLGDAEAAVRALPPEGVARYGDMLRTFMQRAYAHEQNGSPPEVVADAVHRALTSKHPRARYPVGKDATLLVTVPRLLGDGLLDRLRYRLFGIPATHA